MNNFKFALIIIILSSSLFSCNTNEKMETADGVEYVVLKEGEGPAYQEGDYGVFYIKYVNQKDSVLLDSKDLGSMSVVIDSSIFKDRGMLFSILRSLNEGDSVKSVIPASDAFSKAFRKPLSSDMKLNDRITVYISAQQLLDSAGFVNYRMQLREEQIAKMKEEASKAKIENKKKIENYIADNSLSVDSTETGLLYVIDQEGTGEKAKAGQTVRVSYTGMLLDGTVFDTSNEEIAKENNIYNPDREYSPYEFVLGQGNVIAGWDQGITLLNKGSKATLIIPSDLAYGPQRMGPVISPNSVLLFHLELVDIQN